MKGVLNTLETQVEMAHLYLWLWSQWIGFYHIFMTINHTIYKLHYSALQHFIKQTCVLTVVYATLGCRYIHTG